MSVQFLHLTDLHLRDPEDEAALGDDAPSARLRGILARAAGLRPAPAFLAITGDLTNDGAPGAYRLLAEILEGTELPVFLTLENHDDRDAFRDVFGGATGPAFRDEAIAGLHVIALDTLVPGRTGGAMSDAALAALDGAL
ncbi:MAG: metallophosphoesterase, partial [Paracoccaceae bacterium]